MKRTIAGKIILFTIVSSIFFGCGSLAANEIETNHAIYTLNLPTHWEILPKEDLYIIHNNDIGSSFTIKGVDSEKNTIEEIVRELPSEYTNPFMRSVYFGLAVTPLKSYGREIEIHKMKMYDAPIHSSQELQTLGYSYFVPTKNGEYLHAEYYPGDREQSEAATMQNEIKGILNSIKVK